MGENVLEILKRMGIFMVIVQTVVHFAAGEEYEKYLKVLVGFMLAAMLIVPLASFLCRDKGWDSFQLKTNQVQLEELDETFTEMTQETILQQSTEEMESMLSSLLEESGYELKEIEWLKEETWKLRITLHSQDTDQTEFNENELMSEKIAEVLHTESSYLEVEIK